MKQIFGCCNLKTGEYIDSSTDVLRYENENIGLYVMGRVEIDGELNNPEKAAVVFSQSREKFTETVQGTYIAVVFDRQAKALFVFHDRSTSPYILYYTENNGKLYIGTSLKTLLKESAITRELNENAVEDFIVNGFNYGEETLVKNVYKLKAFSYFEIKNGKYIQKNAEYPVDKLTKGEALDKFRPALDEAIEKCFKNEEEINLPLSSGFDSNYIAYIASTKGKAPVNAFSVGGKFGKNELPVVEKNVKYYDRFQLKSALTDKNTLQNLPDIVWRLEGSVYEVGLFLQYELNKLVNKSGKNYLVCGECADQVMNKYYLQENRIHPEKENGKPVYYEFSEYPFIFGNYLILKKNGILANSFGIEARYPYLDNDIVAISHALRNINGKDKRIHTANCSELLPEEILKNMSKIGGATECHSLFNSKPEIKEFFNKIEKSGFYKDHAEMIKRHSLAEKQKQTGVAKIKTKVLNFIKKMLHISNAGNEYFNDEMKLREYICVAYLIVFEKLFIGREYEKSFGSTGTDLKLKDLI